MTQQTNLYIQRINDVTNYIRDNLTEPLSLDVVADVAHFSPFHFHRIFKDITGETLNQFVGRTRLERAAWLLRTNPNMRMTDAAVAAGFQSSSNFSRSFKQHYGIAPREWDRNTQLYSQESKIRQKLDAFPRYTPEDLREIAQRGEVKVEVREQPELTLAYIRVINAYSPDRVVSAYNRLIDWYITRGGDMAATTAYGMSQDDPDLVPLEQYRYDICLTVPDDWTGEGEVNLRRFPACKLAAVRCVGDIYVVDMRWQFLFRHWLPHSRYQPDNLPAMEIYHQQPCEIGWETYDMDAAVPIIAL